jgi:hypothetical protein
MAPVANKVTRVTAMAKAACADSRVTGALFSPPPCRSLYPRHNVSSIDTTV